MLEKLVREELEHGEEKTQCRADRRDPAAATPDITLFRLVIDSKQATVLRIRSMSVIAMFHQPSGSRADRSLRLVTFEQFSALIVI